MAKRRVHRPWLPAHKPFDSGRVGQRWEGYKTPRWRKLSILFKSNPANAICRVEGCGRPTHYTDHVIPVLKLIQMGRDPYDVDNECQPLCRLHGDQKTGSEGAASKG